MSLLSRLRPRKPRIIFSLSIVTFFLLTGCGSTPKSKTDASSNTQKADAKAQADIKAAKSPEAHVFVDDAMLSRPYAIIGGTVENVGESKLEKLSVEVELKRRDDGSTERREVAVAPGDLAPGEKGKYTLKVLSDEWSSSRVVALRSASRQEEVAFKSFPGAERPPERVPDRVTIVKTPRQKRSNGDEFINTPDTPVKVP